MIRVRGGLKMFRVPIRRRVAAADMSSGQTESQVDPGRTELKHSSQPAALGAAPSLISRWVQASVLMLNTFPQMAAVEMADDVRTSLAFLLVLLSATSHNRFSNPRNESPVTRTSQGRVPQNPMKKMVHRRRVAILLAIIGLTGCLSSEANPGNRADRTRMSEETAAFIRDRKIPLKGTDAEFYGNKEEQVYLLNSQDRVKLNSKASEKNTVAVINQKHANGKSNFYIIEQEITPKQITFLLRKDSKVLESLLIRVGAAPHPGVGNCQSFCDSMEANNKAQLQAVQVEVNGTCSTTRFCLPMCGCVGGVGTVVGWATYAIYPTSLRCGMNVASRNRASQFWTSRNLSPFLGRALDTAIKKEAKLYSTEP
jgi:hypothetical protein